MRRCSAPVSQGSHDSMPSNTSPSARRSHCWRPHGASPTRRAARCRTSSVGSSSRQREQLDLGQILGRTLVAHGELAQPVDLVTPKVDADGDVGGRAEHVDDRSPDRDLAPMFNLILAAVAHAHQPGHEGLGVDLLALADDHGLDVLDVRTEALQQ